MTTFWNGKKVLVTGADGFIGSHMVEALLKEGARVRAFVFYNSFGHWGWLDEIDRSALRDIEVFPGDIRDGRLVAEAVKGREIVFHLCSLIAIPYSYRAPESYVQTNIGGALNVLNACRNEGIGRLVHTSTSEVYGTARYVPIDEQHPLQGQSPYSASKIGADMLAESFSRAFGLPVTTVRPFNTYGPRQSARAVIPTILSQLHRREKTIKLGAVSPTRDFNFVADTVAGFLAVARSEKAVGHVVNLGSGKDISIGDLAETIMRITGLRADIVCESERLRPAQSEVNRLLCDATRAREWASWEPRHSLEDGLLETSQWIGDNLRHFKPDLYHV